MASSFSDAFAVNYECLSCSVALVLGVYSELACVVYYAFLYDAHKGFK